MTFPTAEKDLVVLVADRNMEAAVRGLIGRARSLHIRDITWDIFTHIENDPGCLLRAHEFLLPFARRYGYALVLFDREGCGQEKDSRERLERQVEDRLTRAGWDSRAAAVVFDPELEIWVWSDSPHVETALGWQGRTPDLRTWLLQQRFLRPAQTKPDRPKEALEGALRVARKPRSSDLYEHLAQRVALRRCQDAAFARFQAILQRWFTKA